MINNSAPTHYHEDTPEEIRNLIRQYMHTPTRVRLFYGDTKTGRDWGEENDVIGTIGRSTGTKPIPLIIANRNSSGGPAILDNCIVRMIANGREVYRHPRYHQPEYMIAAPNRDGSVDVFAELNGKSVNTANFKNHAAAERWIAFMTGHRMSK